MLLKSHFWTGWAAHPQLHQNRCKEGNLFFSFLLKTILVYMKSLFKNKMVLLVTILDVVFTVGVPFLIHIICVSSGVNNFIYPFLFAIFTFMNGLLAYLVGDLIIVIYKKKNGLVTSSIPQEVSDKAKEWRYPFIISLIIDLVIFGVFAIIFSSTGHWPLL